MPLLFTSYYCSTFANIRRFFLSNYYYSKKKIAFLINLFEIIKELLIIYFNNNLRKTAVLEDICDIWKYVFTSHLFI